MGGAFLDGSHRGPKEPGGFVMTEAEEAEALRPVIEATIRGVLQRGCEFVGELPAGAEWCVFRGRVFVAHPDHPVREFVNGLLVDLFPVFPGEW